MRKLVELYESDVDFSQAMDGTAFSVDDYDEGYVSGTLTTRDGTDFVVELFAPENGRNTLNLSVSNVRGKKVPIIQKLRINAIFNSTDDCQDFFDELGDQILDFCRTLTKKLGVVGILLDPKEFERRYRDTVEDFKSYIQRI